MLGAKELRKTLCNVVISVQLCLEKPTAHFLALLRDTSLEIVDSIHYCSRRLLSLRGLALHLLHKRIQLLASHVQVPEFIFKLIYLLFIDLLTQELVKGAHTTPHL